MPRETLNRFGDRPRTKLAWWSMGLGSGALLLLVATSVLPDVDLSWGELNVVPSLLLLTGLAALVIGIAAYRRGERSFVLWIGLVPGVLFALLLIAEIAFIE
jgi:hypothetical protein